MLKKVCGLTLIEVLIALAIIGISLTAVIKAASQNIRSTDYLRNKTIALWVAQNVMSEAQLTLIDLSGPSGREKEETVLGKDWFWHATEEASANARIKKIHVRVYAAKPVGQDETALIDLDGYRYVG